MDITTTLTAITAMSIEDRIELVQAIWDSIAAEQRLPDLSESQKKELDRRIAELDAAPDTVLTWEQIKAHVRRRQ